MNFIDIGIEQIKTLYAMCLDAGTQPEFQLSDFMEAMQEVATESENSQLRQIARFHKILHEILHPPTDLTSI